MLNLVIDASGIFYRTLFTVIGYETKKGEKFLDTRKSQGIFMRKLASDFSTLVRSIDDPCRVIVCMDSSSWRKTISIEDGGYKADRKKDDSSINWKSFFELTDKFAAVLSSKGYILSRVHGAEGDDLLFFWSQKLNDQKENVIMITGDKDLLQVVNKHENGSWTVAIDPVLNRKKISLTQESLNFSPPEDNPVDLFNPDSWANSSDILEKYIKNYELNIVDTRKLSMMKVILGDGGDSVPAIITWKDKKEPEKIRSITENNFNKIVLAHPSIENASWKDLRAGKYTEEIATVIESLKKIEVDRDKLVSNIERNCKLVVLSFDTIPDELYQRFLEAHKEIPNSLAVTGRDGILGGTEWWTADKSADFIPKSYDLFG